jgi:hypothetical protein
MSEQPNINGEEKIGSPENVVSNYLSAANEEGESFKVVELQHLSVAPTADVETKDEPGTQSGS